MFNRRKAGACVAPIICLILAEYACGAPIVTLFDTGIATNSPTTGLPTSVLADGVADPHYTLLSTPATNTPASAFVVDQTTYPFSVWTADTSSSKWISVQGDESNISEPVGEYFYQTSFDLTGFIPATASISGTFYDDDEMTDIMINSTDTGISYQPTNVTGGRAFSITAGFVAGLNTITFEVKNDMIPAPQDPTGLDVVMTGTATAVPEPATLGLLSGAAMLLLGRKRRVR